MTQDEVTWVLDTIKANVPGIVDDTGGAAWEDIPLYRVNRDESLVLETGERKRKPGIFERANKLGAARATRSPTAVGPGYRNRVETVVSCRLEGAHALHRGHIDPDGHLPPQGEDDGVPFETLVRACQAALLQERSYPSIETDGLGAVAYHTLFVEGEADLSHEKRDYYRRDWDVRLVGYSNPDDT